MEKMSKIKVGQVWRQQNKAVFVITAIADTTISVLYTTGWCLTDSFADNFKFVFRELVAEYPTWQEAVNSKEFRERLLLDISSFILFTVS